MISMNFIATVTHFVVVHETAVFVSLILALVLIQWTFVIPAFINDKPSTNENDSVNDDGEETARTHLYTHHSLFKF